LSTIRNKLITAITVSSLLSVIISYLLLNFTISRQYQILNRASLEARDRRIVQVFRDSYTRDSAMKWTESSGTSVIKEAQSQGFSVQLDDEYGKMVWQLPIDSIISELNAKGDSSTPVTPEQFSTNVYPVEINGEPKGYITVRQYTPLIMSSEQEKFIFNLIISVLLSSIIGSVVIVFLSFFLSRQLTDPIKSISSTSYLLSIGNLNAREDMETDIYEIEKLKQSINLLGEKLERQNVLRKRLVSDISHELRNPLNVLQTNLEAMTDGVLPMTTERLQSLNNEVVRFGKLLGNLNVLKEFESETLDVVMKPVNLKNLCQDIYNNFHGFAQEKGIILTFEHYRRDSYMILGDSHGLNQVVINLLHNALKFTPRDGKISMILKKDSSFTYLLIRDTGMGIPDEDLSNIFERFYRVDKSREEVEGSGIGLTIVKNIMERHRGKISVTSEVNKGTTFTLKFRNLPPDLDNLSFRTIGRDEI